MTNNPHTLLDGAGRFTRCSISPEPHLSLLTWIRMVGEGRDPGCSNTQPWWTNLWVSATTAAGIGTALVLTGHDPFTVLLLAVAGFVAWTLAATVLNPRHRHACCEICGGCSVAIGVPPAMSRKRARANLRAHGWTLSPTGRRAHCPGHADVPFVATY